MREVVLDTETTGFDPEAGDRVVEIGAVELMGHVPTGRHFHAYLNPERPMPEAAFAVHGLGDEFLATKPVFAAVAQDFVEFIGDAPLVIHNAAFDMKFLNHELGRLGHAAMPMGRAVDTVALARRKYPGSPASLDALCRRFGIDTTARTLHGALLDSEILAEVYLELIGGRQPGLLLGSGDGSQDRLQDGARGAGPWRPRPRPAPLPSRITDAERAAHEAFVAPLGDGALWRR
jgi:DNA polymerase-3 subunit epsilon